MSGDFTTLIAEAERALRYADEAGSLTVFDYLQQAAEVADRALDCAPNGCCRFLADDIAMRCYGMIDQIGFPRGIEAARKQLDLLQSADQTPRVSWPMAAE